MTLLDAQFSFGGLVMGDQTNYDVTGWQGLDDQAHVRVGNYVRGRDHGEWFGANFLPGRDVTLDIEILGTDNPTFRANVEALKAALLIGTAEAPLAFQLPGMSGNRQMNCVVAARALPGDMNYNFRHGQGSILFHATDPRTYDATLQSATVGLPSSTGGAAWPVSWPLSFGSASAGGTLTATNAGNFPTRPLITIVGPVDNPSIFNATTGQSVTFLTSLTSADTLVIDMDARSAIVNGTAYRRSSLAAGSQWWELAPGVSTINYRANTAQVGSTMTLSWRSAWI